MKKSRLLRGCALATTLIFTSGCAMVSNVDIPISSNMDKGAKKTLWERDLCGVRTSKGKKAEDIALTDLYPQQGCVAFASALISWKRYRDAADDITTDQNLVNIGILGLAAGTIWAAVSEGPDDLVAGLGLGTAVLYAGSSILAPEQKREIYRAGAKAAACVMRRANSILTDPVITGNYQHRLNELTERYLTLRQGAASLQISETEPEISQLSSISEIIRQDQQNIDTHNLKGSRVAVEISQLLIEIDDKMRELLDQTLPNPATIFETVQRSTTGYLTQANAAPTLPSSLPLEEVTLLTTQKADKTKEQLKTEINVLSEDLETFHLKLQATLQVPYEFDFAGCNDLGIDTTLVLTESEISLQAGQSATVGIIGGKRPIRAAMTRKPAGLTLERDFNQDGDTEFTIHWNGTGNQYGSYPMRFIDDNGASNVLTLDLSPGLVLAETALKPDANNTITLSIKNGTPPFYIFYQGGETAPDLKTKASTSYAYGEPIADQPITLTMPDNGMAADTTGTFMIVDKTGKSASFSITAP
ncbi:hypothetical protein [Thalassospira sp. TSL5-1]|uniref:hypothetical protein n=1 Tax=Thalassospira sp. TSL5-1 TaxID=1544451 RepID=UPI00093C3FA8|nr:hypothetical protein [Thalassospira sp. TSL5-1]OKH86412.1 hypothetical protein LF95_22645 [Thalassospira sp. TSL5-1]